MKKTSKFVAAVLMAASASFLLTGCHAKGSLSSPVTEDSSSQVTYNSAPLLDSQKLLETGMPVSISSTDPANFGFKTAISINNLIVPNYLDTNAPTFDDGKYTDLTGIITFRGNNYRSNPVFGTASITEKKFDTKNSWKNKTGKLKKTVKDGYWTGSCWTGQPLIMKWDDSVRMNMTAMYTNKQNKDGLVEVIYATADGHVYFYDIDDGKPTRDPIALGFPIKGTGSIYPDGTPLYFVGAGDSMGNDCAKAFVINLMTNEIIYTYGENDVFSDRTDNNAFTAWDSSPLIDVETDTLIQPGENGILYLTKLNTSWDGTTVSINPASPIKWRYSTDRSRNGLKDSTYWLGMESSAVAWKNYLYIADNCGDLFCLDLNTLNVIWSCDTKDDTNCSPVLEEDPVAGTAYIYISTSLHWTADDTSHGSIPLMKINAATGEIIWQRDYNCFTVSGVSGGVQSTALLGQNSLKDIVYFTVARTGGDTAGKIVALNKTDGSIVWSIDMSDYTWSSPIAIYDEAGNGYVVISDSSGNMYLLDGLTGKEYDSYYLKDNVEASPAAYENTIVVGTRGKKIYGVKVK